MSVEEQSCSLNHAYLWQTKLFPERPTNIYKYMIKRDESNSSYPRLFLQSGPKWNTK